MGQKENHKEIRLGDDCGDIVIKVNGVSIEVRRDGHVMSQATAPNEPKVGYQMLDGTIYAGVSPDTGKAMYAMPADTFLTMTFNEAADYAAKLDAHGHKGWRVPTKAELNLLFNNRAAIGGFDTSGTSRNAWYWSSEQHMGLYAWEQRFSIGSWDYNGKSDHASVRCVR